MEWSHDHEWWKVWPTLLCCRALDIVESSLSLSTHTPQSRNSDVAMACSTH